MTRICDSYELGFSEGNVTAQDQLQHLPCPGVLVKERLGFSEGQVSVHTGPGVTEGKVRAHKRKTKTKIITRASREKTLI